MEVRIWLASLDDLDLGSADELLSPEELRRAERMQPPARGRRFLARRLMARALLAEETEEDPAGLTMERHCERCGGTHPVSPLAAGSRSVWWSASSSGGTSALAIADRRVGIDVERLGESPRWEGIARRFYTGAEQRAVDGSPTRFLELWTMKEAYLKAVGLGLAGGLRALDCAALTDAGGGWLSGPDHPGWRFSRPPLAPALVAAIAVEGEADSIEVRRWGSDGREAR